MQLSVERALERVAQSGLDPAYFLFGEEPLQLLEVSDAIRGRARDDGIIERLVFDIESASDWEAVKAESGALSLFSDRRLIEIRLGSRKPDKRGTAMLEELFAAPAGDDVCLVSAGNLDGRARKAAWFKLLEKHTTCIQTRDLNPAQLPAWLNRRAARFNKRLSTSAADLISDRVEGNLLAAAQEVEKLCLLVDGDVIDEAEVITAVTDSTRFDVYQFVDAVLARKLARALRIARGLREEGTEPVLLVWALGRELRSLVSMAQACEGGQSIQVVMDQHRVWSNRKSLIGAVLDRFSAAQLTALLATANHIDTIIKGGRMGAPWDEIELLVLRLFGWRGAAKMQSINQTRAA